MIDQLVKGYPSEPVIYMHQQYIHHDNCAGILAHLIKHDLDNQPVDSV